MKVFLSFSFHDAEKPLVELVERLFVSHDVRMITGKNLGGEALTPAVMERINETDALVALMTRREALPGDNRYMTHPWVRDEMNHARSQQKLAIALVENGVDLAGAYKENEYIPLLRENPTEAMVRLSETLGRWRDRLGRMLQVKLSPDDLAVRVARDDGRLLRCRYRLSSEGEFKDWREVRPVREVGGVFLYLKGVGTDDLVEVEVQGAGQTWSSPATGQWVHIQLEEPFPPSRGGGLGFSGHGSEPTDIPKWRGSPPPPQVTRGGRDAEFGRDSFDLPVRGDRDLPDRARPRVFLTGGFADAELAQALRRVLKDRGLDAVLTEDLDRGGEIGAGLEAAFRQGPAALVVVLSSTLGSWVQKELELARKHHLTILPVFVGTTPDPLPALLRGIAGVVVRKADELDAVARELARRIA